MNHEFLQLIGALTTAAGFLVFLYMLAISGFSWTPLIIFFVGIGVLFLSRYLAKKDLEKRRKKSKYLSSLDKQKAAESTENKDN